MIDDERIAKKAHELWEADGRPHGRDQFHWAEAREIIAIEDSEADTLLPRLTGAETPVEEKSIAIDNEAEAPSLTDTGDHDLTAIDREPTFSPGTVKKAAAKKASTRADAAKRSDAVGPKKSRAKTVPKAK